MSLCKIRACDCHWRKAASCKDFNDANIHVVLLLTLDTGVHASAVSRDADSVYQLACVQSEYHCSKGGVFGLS